MLFQADLNGKLAVELLFAFSGGRPNTPSGSGLKESFLMDRRRDILDDVRWAKNIEIRIHLVLEPSWSCNYTGRR